MKGANITIRLIKMEVRNRIVQVEYKGAYPWNGYLFQYGFQTRCYSNARTRNHQQ